LVSTFHQRKIDLNMSTTSFNVLTKIVLRPSEIPQVAQKLMNRNRIVPLRIAVGDEFLINSRNSDHICFRSIQKLVQSYTVHYKSSNAFKVEIPHVRLDKRIHNVFSVSQLNKYRNETTLLDAIKHGSEPPAEPQHLPLSLKYQLGISATQRLLPFQRRPQHKRSPPRFLNPLHKNDRYYSSRFDH